MAQHISGSVASSQSLDYGEFIQCFDLRVRKDLVVAYIPVCSKDPDGVEHFSVHLMVSGGWNTAKCNSMAEAQAEVERLDWIFKKERT